MPYWLVPGDLLLAAPLLVPFDMPETWGLYWGGSGYGYTKSYDTAILIVDAKKKSVLYRGLAKGAYRVNGDPTQDDIRGFVTKMLKGFPARSQN